MNEDLKSWVNEYIETVNKVCILMLKGLNLKSKTDLLEQRKQHQVGEFYLDNRNEYMFHGIGCRFCNNKIKIDWDFGYDDKWCGIDPWKFYCYLKENHKDISMIYNKELIKREFEKAVANGEMIKKYELYYIAEEVE